MQRRPKRVGPLMQESVFDSLLITLWNRRLFFNLFLEVSHIQENRTIMIQIGKKNIGIQKSSENLEKAFFYATCWPSVAAASKVGIRPKKVDISIRSWDKRQKLATGLQWGQIGYQVSGFFCNFKQLAHQTLFCLFVCVEEYVHL